MKINKIEPIKNPNKIASEFGDVSYYGLLRDCCKKVNEIVEWANLKDINVDEIINQLIKENADFKVDITNTINTFTDSITKKQDDLTKSMSDYKISINTDFETFKQTELSARNSFENEIKLSFQVLKQELNSEYVEFTNSVNKSFTDFQTKINNDFTAHKNAVSTEFNALSDEFDTLNNSFTALKNYVENYLQSTEFINQINTEVTNYLNTQDFKYELKMLIEQLIGENAILSTGGIMTGDLRFNNNSKITFDYGTGNNVVSLLSLYVSPNELKTLISFSSALGLNIGIENLPFLVNGNGVSIDTNTKAFYIKGVSGTENGIIMVDGVYENNPVSYLVGKFNNNITRILRKIQDLNEFESLQLGDVSLDLDIDFKNINIGSIINYVKETGYMTLKANRFILDGELYTSNNKQFLLKDCFYSKTIVFEFGVGQDLKNEYVFVSNESWISGDFINMSNLKWSMDGKSYRVYDRTSCPYFVELTYSKIGNQWRFEVSASRKSFTSAETFYFGFMTSYINH